MRGRRPVVVAPLFLLLSTCAPSPTAPEGHRRGAVEDPTANMVLVPAGQFLRGRDNPERPDEGPPRAVSLSAFYMDATLVTRAAFAKFIAETGYVTTAETLGYGMASYEGMGDWEWERIPNGSWKRPFWDEKPDRASFFAADAPVVMVSFFDAEAYCRHAAKRLPSEAEWEYAMRAGSNGTRYPWGDEPRRADGRYGLNFWQGASHEHNDREDGYVYVSPVRAFPPNAWGIHDPVGNVWQWTSDWYAPDTYARASGARDPIGPGHGTKKVLRGGSWWCGACTCEGNGLFYRGKADPSAPFNNNGFRCARGARATTAPQPAAGDHPAR